MQGEMFLLLMGSLISVRGVLNESQVLRRTRFNNSVVKMESWWLICNVYLTQLNRTLHANHSTRDATDG